MRSISINDSMAWWSSSGLPCQFVHRESRVYFMTAPTTSSCGMWLVSNTARFNQLYKLYSGDSTFDFTADSVYSVLGLGIGVSLAGPPVSVPRVKTSDVLHRLGEQGIVCTPVKSGQTSRSDKLWSLFNTHDYTELSVFLTTGELKQWFVGQFNLVGDDRCWVPVPWRLVNPAPDDRGAALASDILFGGQSQELAPPDNPQAVVDDLLDNMGSLLSENQKYIQARDSLQSFVSAMDDYADSLVLDDYDLDI